MSSQRLSFQNKAGFKLSASLELPECQPIKAYALFAHCFTCSKNLNAVHHIAKALNERNIALLRFDFTGLGQSEGDFASTNFSSNVDDLVLAANFLADNFLAPQILIGHSLGGAAILQAATQIASAKALVTIGAPCNPSHVTHMLKNELAAIEQKGEAEIELAGRSLIIKKQFLDDLNEANMKSIIAGLDKALLVMHSPFDDIVDIDNAADIFKTAKHPKSFISLDTADHLLTNETDAKYVGEVIAEWVSRYLEKSSIMPSEHIPQSTVIVKTGKGYCSEAYTANHYFLVDEPIQSGGSDAGPSPSEYLSAALAACKTITARMYADRKSMPLEKITTRVHMKQENDANGMKKSDFYVDLNLEGELTEQQRERILYIANKCPVQKVLEGEVKIHSKLSTL